MMCFDSDLLILSFFFFLAGNARVMGETAPEIEHLQIGAEEKPSGGVGCSQLLRPLFKRKRAAQIHDKYHS